MDQLEPHKNGGLKTMYIKTLKHIMHDKGFRNNERTTNTINHIIKPINYKHNTKTKKQNYHIKYYNLLITAPARKNNYKYSRLSIANYKTKIVKYRDIKTWI